MLVEQNLAYRAVTKNADEKRAVEEAFARSVLWGFKVEAEENGRVLVDATPFLLNDAHGVAEKLKEKKQGTYKVDDARSAIYLPFTKNFPKNTEFEATLTFAGEPTGDWIRSVTPTPRRSRCASIIPSSNCPTINISRASSIRAPAIS